MQDNVSGQEWPILTVTEPQHLQSGVDVLGKASILFRVRRFINYVASEPIDYSVNTVTQILAFGDGTQAKLSHSQQMLSV